MTSATTDVLVVGAGPTGLMLAGDLARAGVSVTVLERRAGRSNLTRAFAVHARTLEQFDQRGVADALLETGRRVTSLRAFGRIAVTFAGLATRFPFVLVTPQYETERVLADRAEKLGVEIVHGAELTGLRQDGDGVTADVRRAADQGGAGGTETWHAAYLVGTDGVHSTVRQALGLPFPGHSAVRSVMLADVRLGESPQDVLTFNGVRDGFAFIVPFGDGWHRVIAWHRHHELPDDAPVDMAELRQVTRAALGTDYGMHDARWTSRFHSDERQARHYRVGRVFLAGDAAHVHSPAGGQGMNTGLQDAANLGWKLAAVRRGRAPDGLLDSYEAERHPVGRMVLRTSGALLRLALVGSTPMRELRDVTVGTAAKIDAVTRRVAGTVSGIDIAYPAPRGAHPLTGRRAPDVRLTGAGTGPARLYEALRAGRFVLVTGAAATASVPLLDGWDADVDVVASAATAATMLVRPDGYVAWATDDPDPAGVLAEATGHGRWPPAALIGR
ncbi:MAG TPA: FAD-dependent oxidoreductase [Streptosporangiaceae bacterium]|jgi:2-polyprenyl-6-methoxyphenol hydroxylase-like FAD-dependent oxidoreductase|nr:FAD-dependent oxidoreductase [Streptosporangiaceae bacterium]